MAKTKGKSQRSRSTVPPALARDRQAERRRLPIWVHVLGIALFAAALAGGSFLLGKSKAQQGSEGPAASAGGLPNTADYHSLMVAPNDPARILLGTHAGLYESIDGGRDWTRVALVGQDAMNLGRSGGQTIWTAGHNVFAKSTDGGETWNDLRPDGLPSLDVHGFAVDPRDGTLWAAVAGEGLYRSTDGGEGFELVSDEVGGNVMALVVTPDGKLLAGDMQKGLLSSESEGRDWRVAEPAAVMGLAVNPDDPAVVIAAGSGILRSDDGGRTWEQVFPLAEGAGPVAWSESDPDVAYAVGFDRMLYRTQDRGASWQSVS